MKRHATIGFSLSFVLLLVSSATLPAATRYVDVASPQDGPGTNWATAFHVIQDGVDAAMAGDVVMVNDGVYDTGKTVVHAMDNRVAVTKAIRVESVNGPGVTVIEGAYPYGPTAVRCAYVGGGAELSGFTLTNGHTRVTATIDPIPELNGGGVFLDGGTVSNCAIVGNYAIEGGAGVFCRSGSSVRDCTIRSNQVEGLYGIEGTDVFGGGVRSIESTLLGCVISNNVATGGRGGDGGPLQWSVGGGAWGGGVYCSNSVVDDVVLGGNQAKGGFCSNDGIAKGGKGLGGGIFADSSTVQGCTIGGNVADGGDGSAGPSASSNATGGMACGGGVYCGGRVVLKNCILADNSARGGHAYVHGGANEGLARGSSGEGGGVYCEDLETVVNCVLTGNEAEEGLGATQYWFQSKEDGSGLGGGLHCHYGGAVDNCTLSSNSASHRGGGVHCYSGGTFRNCIVWANTAEAGHENWSHQWAGAVWSHCCTTPRPSPNSTTNDPLLVAVDDVRLQSGSPCIDMAITIPGLADDIAGTPRPLDGDHDGAALPDIGAYERIDASMDTDHDGLSDADEWHTYGTDLFNPDTDGDKLPDGWEVDNGYDPLVPEITSTHYVDVGNSTPSFPYITWDTAATSIQSAVDAASSDDTVLVADGVYDRGGSVASTTSNRVAVSEAIVLRSVRGPEHTFIVGQGPRGPGAVRCSYVASGAELIGFTLTGGHTATEGTYTDRSGGGVLLDGDGTVSNCVIESNVAAGGGGAYCTSGGSLANCILRDNAAEGSGGGAYCHGGVLTSCSIHGNVAANRGGGVYVNDATLSNCTIVANSAERSGGVHCDHDPELYNCIVWGNGATMEDANWGEGWSSESTWVRCCTLPAKGVNCVFQDPRFTGVNDYHLELPSPCIDAGENVPWMTDASDLDGNARIMGRVVDIGAYEHVTMAIVDITNENVTVANDVEDFSIAGTNNTAAAGALTWTNEANGANGTMPVAGTAFQIQDIPLALGANVITVYGGDGLGRPDKDLIIITRSGEHGGDSPIHYVATNGAAIWPYTNWTAAATTIQEAVDAAESGDTVMVGDGIYDRGGASVHGMDNRVALVKAVGVESANGPDRTLIVGAESPAVRCAYLTNGAELVGFTLSEGHARVSGDWPRQRAAGGVFLDGGGDLRSCVLTSNDDYAVFFHGDGTVTDSTISSNSSSGVYCNGGGTVRDGTIGFNQGSGAICFEDGLLQDCVITANAGRGVVSDHGGTILRCTISYNLDGGVDCFGGQYTGCAIVGNATASSGGGVHGYMGSFSGCTISSNSAVYNGGGVDVDGSVTFGGFVCSGCVISENTSGGSGGGVSTYYSAVLEDCAISNNTAGASGGGISSSGYHAWFGGAWIFDCTIVSNRADSGGGVACHGATLEECTISMNVVSNHGGGMLAGDLVEVDECTIYSNFAMTNGGGVVCQGALFNDCTIEDNLASYGGGAYVTNGGSFTRCEFIGNGAYDGGGAFCAAGTILTHCTVLSNSVTYSGGGIYCNLGGTLNDCTIIGNQCGYEYGGGVHCNQGGAVNRCIVSGNTSRISGGGIFCFRGGSIAFSTISSNEAPHGGGAYLYKGGTVQTCEIAHNRADRDGGGAYCAEGGTLVSVSISGNEATSSGGGIFCRDGGTLVNCIVWGNSDPGGGNWYADGTGMALTNCCTTPSVGVNCVANDPLYAAPGDYHIAPSSPCVDAGTNWMLSATDLDGYPRVSGGTVDIGAYEAGQAYIGIDGDDATVGGTTGDYIIHGNHAYLAGSLWWTNSANEAGGTLLVSGARFNLGSIPLAFYANTITVFGSNLFGTVVSDSVTITRDPEDLSNTPFHYVSPAGGHVWPFITWANASTSIQMAVDTAAPYGYDAVIVSNGWYEHGGAVVNNMSNRVALTKPVTVESLHGPLHTVVVGEGPLGPSAVRCAYVTNGASLVGFTLTNGHTHTMSTLWEHSGGGVLARGTVSNCIVTGNAAQYGGGAYCAGGALVNCLFSRNSAVTGGGGVYMPGSGTLENCTLGHNSASAGGGVMTGLPGSALYNCVVWGNSPGNWLGGVNWANCCTTPAVGVGCVTNDPLFAPGGSYHLAPASPCVDAGVNRPWMAGATDLAGHPRINEGVVDIGAYEYGLAVLYITNQNETVAGPVDTYDIGGTNSLWVVGSLWWANRANGADGKVPAIGSSFLIEDVPLALLENFITVYGTNGSGGVVYDSVTITRNPEHTGDSPVHYVATNGAAIWPYTNWADAVTTIQLAVETAADGDLVLVGDGTYGSGTWATPGHGCLNRVVITNNITVKSLNGPQKTVLSGAPDRYSAGHGAGAVRGVYMSAGVLSGFTITNGYTWPAGGHFDCSGGGIHLSGGSGVVMNCNITGNSAGWDGGGSYGGFLANCILSENSASYFGGGSCQSTLENCTLSANFASLNGGGTYQGALTNCVIWGNSAGSSGDEFYDSMCVVCCTVPDTGFGGISADPRFLASGDYHLRADSPCVDAGVDRGLADDIEGTPRPLDGDHDSVPAPDIGAYEYDPAATDTDGDGLPDGDEVEIHGTSPVSTNTDGDPSGDYEEYIADTDGADSNDWFRIVDLVYTSVWFHSSTARQYTLVFTTNAVEQTWSNVPGQTDVIGHGGLDFLTDPSNRTTALYGVEVEVP